ncbi:MAG: isoprenyl transferase [Oscillospiraceae bacterium]|jgi:undecaprenyl diphosphate synthase|nr:isoprenyl transferase [Oscillospiraceae bacterium]MBQ8929306.1 isoprenyl transferase [Oscillospiraceae bacterium]MBR6429783.1 isoprenyl transferase [Oscillospiraceae bacterium]
MRQTLETKAGRPGADRLPRHIAIIMDGNGRWAKKRGLPRTMGHKAGAETFRNIALYCQKLGVEYLTVYAFSTENWKRPAEEVSAIMGLLESYLTESIEKMVRQGVRLQVLGDIAPLPERIRRLIDRTDALSRTIDGMTASLCVNYGGRDEIVRAARAYAADYARDGRDLTEQSFSRYLYTADMPDPDLLIRPSGEQRISNFLLWQCAYSEFYYTDTLWPDFDEAELDRAIAAYQRRDRRYGGVNQ